MTIINVCNLFARIVGSLIGIINILILILFCPPLAVIVKAFYNVKFPPRELFSQKYKTCAGKNLYKNPLNLRTKNRCKSALKLPFL